jgi:hypothetical protein
MVQDLTIKKILVEIDYIFKRLEIRSAGKLKYIVILLFAAKLLVQCDNEKSSSFDGLYLCLDSESFD